MTGLMSPWITTSTIYRW